MKKVKVYTIEALEKRITKALKRSSSATKKDA